MKKRSHSEFSRHEEDRENESEVYKKRKQMNEILQKTELNASLLRLVLAKNSRNTKLRREHLQSLISDSRVKHSFQSWFLNLDNELKRVFGLSLKQNGSELHLVSHLHTSSGKILQDLLSSETSPSNVSSTLQSALFLMQKQKRSPVVVNSSEQLLGGLVILVICLLVISEDNMSETELLRCLKKFGFSENMTSFCPVFNKSTQSILAELTKRDYISKRVVQGQNTSNATSNYSMGKRSLREFDKETINKFLREMCGEHNEKVTTTLSRCFPDGN